MIFDFDIVTVNTITAFAVISGFSCFLSSIFALLCRGELHATDKQYSTEELEKARLWLKIFGWLSFILLLLTVILGILVHILYNKL